MRQASRKNPAISIIVPVYNVEKFVAECIDSILGQSFHDYEILLIDDASTDGSMEICRRYEEKDARIKIFANSENLGPALTRNRGLREASGKYVAFIDSDDIVAQNYLQVLWGEAERHAAEVVSMGYTEYREDSSGGKYVQGRQMRLAEKTLRFTDDRNQRMEIMCSWALALMTCGKLLRRDFLILHHLKFEQILAEDVLFNFAVLYAADTYILLSDALYYYRKTNDSITRGRNIDKAKKSLRSAVMVHRFLDRYLKRMPDVYMDKAMTKKIHFFFTEAFWTYLFFQVANGLMMKDVMDMSDDVFAELMPEDSEFVGYLFQKFLMAKSSVGN